MGRRARPRKVDQESENEIMPQRKRRQTDIRKTRETSSSRRRGRNVKQPVYFENDEDEPPEPETRPKRDTSSKRSRDQDAYQEESSAAADSDGNDSEENWDDESEMDD